MDTVRNFGFIRVELHNAHKENETCFNSITIIEFYNLFARTSMEFNEDKSVAAHNSTLHGAIFMSNRMTKEECFKRKLFGLPSSMTSFVKKVKSGMVLFLFEYEERKLYGVFVATCDGATNIDPWAFSSSGKSFSAQIRYKVSWLCNPLYEHEFRDAIKDNYYTGNKFSFSLSSEQVNKLLKLFYSQMTIKKWCRPYSLNGRIRVTVTNDKSDTALDALSSSSSDYLSLDVAPMSEVYKPSPVPEFSDPCDACIPFSRGRYFQKNIYSTSIDGLSFPYHNYKGLSPNNEYNQKVVAWDGGGNGGHGFHHPISHEDNRFTLVESSLHADTCNKKTSVFSRLSFTEPRAQNDERHVINFIEQVGLRCKSWHPVREFKLGNMQNNSSCSGSTTDMDVGAADAFESEEDLGHSGGTVEESNESAFLDFKRRREARKAASETETVFSDHGGSSSKNKKRKLIRPSFSNEPCCGEGTSKFINMEDEGNTVI